MAPISTVSIEGVDALLRKLDQIGGPNARKFALKVVAEGAKPVRAAIRSEAPVADKDTTGRYAHPRGALKKGVRYKASRKRTGAIGYVIGAFGRGTAQRHLVMGGHEIVGHKPNLTHTGKRTHPNDFVERGDAKSRAQALAAIEAKAHTTMETLANG